MEALLLIVILGAFIAIVVDLLGQLPTTESHKIRKWLVEWFIKGVVVPIVVWMVFNMGVFQNLPDFVSSRMLQKMNGVNRDATLLLIFVGVVVITTYWTALTSGWLLAMLTAYDVDKREVFKRIRWLAILLSPLALLIVASFGWGALGVAGTVWLLPVVKAAGSVTGEPARRIRPTYSKAAIHVQRGKYEDAEQEVLAELEQHQDDFDGWMLLAELYANRFSDLPAAARMINETCDQPTTTISEVAVAYHRLADWYVKQENNSEAAINTLEQICRRYPNTHVDRMARLRIRNISGEEEEKRAEPRTIHLPSLGRGIERESSVEQNVDAAAAQARRCSEILKKNPNDTAARETFARILAEQLGKADVAIEQLQLLLDLAATDEAAQARIPEWLSLISSWQLKYRNDEPSAVATMNRLVRDHSNTAQAFAAQRRLHMIEMEHRMRRHRASREIKGLSEA
ncbi:MAG: tetratricopeptide repeat protein [Limisphaerales bacterium]